jgi:hypothetical protein
MIQTYYILKGDDRNIYHDVPKQENHSRLVYAADAATALAWRNKAHEAEFTFDEIEYTCTRNKRVTTKTVETVQVVTK